MDNENYMSKNLKVWALLDERQGNTSQTIGVAEALGLPFDTKQIEFNNFIRIPNILINHSLIGVAKESRKLLAPPFPDIVIVTARRLGIVASYIKHKSPKTFIVLIQSPGGPSKHFDLVAAPVHDNPKKSDNMLVTIGAPHRVTKDRLEKEANLWRDKTSHLQGSKIAVLIGGSVRTHEFGAKHGEELAKLASDLANNVNGSLMITTSRRTGETVPKVMEQFLTAPNLFHKWNENETKEQNPFYGFLGLADAVIVTGDSISMCSEACATGKPVYIYSSPDFVPTKHQEFINHLFVQGLAKPLLQSDNQLFAPPFCMNDAKLVADEIKRKLTNKT
jgi:uncharacterized protein